MRQFYEVRNLTKFPQYIKRSPDTENFDDIFQIPASGKGLVELSDEERKYVSSVMKGRLILKKME